MKIFKRIQFSVRAGVENLLDCVENRRAAADAAIRACRDALAKSELRVDRVHRQVNELETQVTEQRQRCETWQARAATFAQSDREKAIEALRRKREAESRLAEIQKDFDAQHALEKRLRADLRKTRENLNTLLRRRDELALRETSAMTGSCTDVRPACDDASRVLDRWEEDVRSSELADDLTALPDPTDSWERELDAEDERRQLEAELDRLGKEQQA